MTIASAALLLFLILDPLGNIPVFLGLLRSLSPQRQRLKPPEIAPRLRLRKNLSFSIIEASRSAG